MSHKMQLRGIDAETLDRMDDRRGDTSREEFVRRALKSVLFPHQPQDELPFGAEPSTVYGSLPFTFIDLFAGRCVYTSELDRFAVETYRHWYGDTGVDESDFTKADPTAIPNHDVLAAGFPCQPFSLAGVSKRRSQGRPSGLQDTKWVELYDALCTAIETKKPPVLFLENVKNLVSHDRGATWEKIESDLESLGYHIFHEVLDARWWVPQHRERLYILGFNKKTFGADKDAIPFEFPAPPRERATLGDILDPDPDRKYMLSTALWRYLKKYKAKHEAAGNGFGFGIADPNGVSRTLSARYHKDGSEILVKQAGWPRPRRLTPREAALLQGFDDRYAAIYGHSDGFPQVVSDTQAYRQFGNAVSPRVVEAIARQLLPIMSQAVYQSGTRTLLGKRPFRREAA